MASTPVLRTKAAEFDIVFPDPFLSIDKIDAWVAVAIPWPSDVKKQGVVMRPIRVWAVEVDSHYFVHVLFEQHATVRTVFPYGSVERQATSRYLSCNQTSQFTRLTDTLLLVQAPIDKTPEATDRATIYIDCQDDDGKLMSVTTLEFGSMDPVLSESGRSYHQQQFHISSS